MTFGVISFHLVKADLVSAALVPVVYAMAMGLEAVAALATGFTYDRIGHRVLLVLPVLIALVPPLAFAGQVWPALAGVAVWGFATGIQDSTVKALVADLVPASGLATAYGVFAAFQGAAALGGGVLAGALYADHLGLLVVLVAVLQVISLGLLLLTPRLRPARVGPHPSRMRRRAAAPGDDAVRDDFLLPRAVTASCGRRTGPGRSSSRCGGRSWAGVSSASSR